MTSDTVRNTGQAWWVLEGPDGEVKGTGHVPNAITYVGDRMYAENGAGVASPPAVPTSMRLGTGTAAVTKTGAGSTLGTPLAGAIASGANFVKSVQGTASPRTIRYVGTFGAGVGTTSGSAITEAVIVNVADGTAAAEANTIARLLFSSTAGGNIGSKGAQDTLTVTWEHNVGTP